LKQATISSKAPLLQLENIRFSGGVWPAGGNDFHTSPSAPLNFSLLSNNSPGIQSSSTQIATSTPFRVLVLSANLFFEDSCL